MSRNLILSLTAFVLLCLGAAWNGRQVRETLAQLDSQVATANRQRLEIGKLNSSFPSVDGRPRTEDSVVAMTERAAPWMAVTTPSLAGAAIGQVALRRTVWLPTVSGAARALDPFENAQTLAAGHFDLALVLIFAWPLLLLFASGQDALRLAVGPLMSLISIPLSGAPLGSADTWLRLAVWIVLAALYGWFWLQLQTRVRLPWLAGAAYAVLVLLIPGLAILLADLAVPPPSRIAQAQRIQEALRPVMDKTSLELAPFYENHPEFVAPGHTIAEYDQTRLRADAARQAAIAPVLQASADAASLHQTAVKILGVLSPASALHLALLETAGTGLTRQADFEVTAQDFGRKWSADVKARVAQGRPLQPADFDRLPRFTYEEQSAAGWLMSAGLGLVALAVWAGAAKAFRR